MIGKTNQLIKDSNNSFSFFYGSCAALVISGLFHDTVFNGKTYFLVFAINTFSIIYQLIVLVFDKLGLNDSSNIRVEAWFLAVFGFTTSFTEFFIDILIPLNIAFKHRTSCELTMAGTMVATVNLTYWVIDGFFDNFYRIWEGSDPSNGTKAIYKLILRIIVLILFFSSSVIIWPKAKKEYYELRAILRKTKCWKCFCCKRDNQYV